MHCARTFTVMCHRKVNKVFIARLMRSGCFLLLLSGCSWMQPKETSSIDEWNLTPAQRESLKVVFKERQQLKNDVAHLQKELKMRDLDIAKLKADLEHQIEHGLYLEEMARIARLDLAHVEKQFVSIEKRLQVHDTKASAVAVLAEVKLDYDNLRKTDSLSVDEATVAEIEQKLAESEKLIRNKNYSAAVYYAGRAHRLLEQYIQLSPHKRLDGETRIVSVSKANLRDGPGYDHEIIGRLSIGTILVQVDQKDEWLQIRTKDGIVGWIHKKLLR